MTCNEVLTPLVVAASGIDDWALGEIATKISKMIWLLRSQKDSIGCR